MSELPSGWGLTSLGELAVEVRNGIATRPEEDGTERILRISSVRPMRLDINDTRLLRGPSSQWSSYRLRLDDLLFTRYNGNPHLVGVCARVHEEPAHVVVYPDKLIRVRLHVGVADPAFVEKVFNVGISRAAVDEKTKTSAGQVGISGADLKNVPVPLAPLPEQRRIVAKLEALTEKSRRAKEALDAIPPLLERFRQSVLAAAFRGDLTAEWRAKNPDVEPADKLLQRIRTERRHRWETSELAKMQAKGKPPTDDRWKQKYEEPKPVDAEELPGLPEGWAWTSLASLAWDSGYGTSEKCGYEGLGPAVLRIPNVAKGVIDLGDVKRSLVADLISASDAISRGDLIIVRTNGSKDLIGRAAVVRADMTELHYFASYLIRFRLLDLESLSDWVSEIWASPSIRQAIERMAASSAGQYNVSLGNLNRLPIPIPPAAERMEVVRLVRSYLVRMDAIDVPARTALGNLDQLNRSILAKAFRGDLVPQDPSDEPASVLLDRIRAERATAAAAKEKKPTKRR